jgi:HD-GYP domain-containing protein (c-di-GMP phosphodiesterase class II)
MLRRSPALAVLNRVAAAHHEKCDGSGYHKRGGIRDGPA